MPGCPSSGFLLAAECAAFVMGASVTRRVSSRRTMRQRCRRLELGVFTTHSRRGPRASPR